MPIRVLELHHHAIRVGASPAAVDAVRDFYVDVLGLGVDPGRRTRSGLAGHWLAVGDRAQIHLIGAEPARGAAALDGTEPHADLDGTEPHFALAVADLVAARAELERLGVEHRVVPRAEGPSATQVFLRDPAGNLVELRQAGARLGAARAHADEVDADVETYARAHGAVMFADMRGFTALAERLPPAQVMPLLNEYFTVLTEATQAHGGTVYHLAGDGLMAGFGVRASHEHAAADAVECASHAVLAAREMLRRFATLARRWKTGLDVDTGLGVGIHAGEVIAGDVGSALYRHYTLIGDTVNVAARLGQRARAGEALFSRTVHAALENAGLDCEVLRLPKLVLRGRAQPVEIYCIPAEERVDWRERELAYA